MGEHRPSLWLRIYLRPPTIGTIEATKLVEFECAPVAVTVVCNAHVLADTWEVTFELEDFPLDPQLIRGATVEIFAANLGELQSSRDAARYWAGISRSEERDHCLIMGVADRAENVFGEDGLKLKLKGRDFTAYFLDAQLTGELRWSDKPFVEVIGELIRQRETTQAMLIEIAVDGASRLLDPGSGVPFEKQAEGLDAEGNPTDPQILSLLKIRPRDYKAFAGDATKGMRMRKPGETTWETIQEIALEAGLICYIELDHLVLRAPKTLNPDTIRRKDCYRFTVGRNVTYQPARDLGRQANANVMVSSFDPMTGKTLTVFSPRLSEAEVDDPGAAGPLGDSASKVGKPTKSRTVVPFVFRGITSVTRLEIIADGLREQLQQNDLEVDLSTDEVTDSDGKPIWSMSYADPVLIDFSATLRSFMTRTLQEQVVSLLAAGFTSEDIDTFLSRGQNDALGGFVSQLRAPLALSEITYKFSSEGNEGWTVAMRLRARKQVTVTVGDKTLKIEVGGG